MLGNSDQILNSDQMNHDHIGKLLSAMQVHGTIAYDLLTASINSIPKVKLWDMSDSNNYRVTTLIFAITMVYDINITESSKFKTHQICYLHIKKSHPGRA